MSLLSHPDKKKGITLVFFKFQGNIKKPCSPGRGDLFVGINAKREKSSVGAACVMPNTYSQIYIQIVFAVKDRLNLIPSQYREELHKYITGIVQNREQKMLSIFCMPDHTHVLVGLKPSVAISDLARDIKAGSSNFINDNKWVPGKFNWQEGFGAFSYSRSHIDAVIKYILHQEAHHRKKTFKEEYLEFLKKYEIKYDEKYLFDWIE